MRFFDDLANALRQFARQVLPIIPMTPFMPPVRRGTLGRPGLAGGAIMTTTRRWQRALAVGFGLGLTVTAGCQTHIISTGMTLPSPHYLEHPPQYFPPDPDYPLQHEVNSQLNQAAAAAAANPAIAGPVAVPATPAGPGARPEASGVVPNAGMAR
jgi:hypothetical protein